MKNPDRTACSWLLRPRLLACLAGMAINLVPVLSGEAQRPQFPDFFEVQPGVPSAAGQPAFFQGPLQAPALGQPQGLPPLVQQGPVFQSPPPPITTTPPPAWLPATPQNAVPPAYDPFGTNTNPWPIQPGYGSTPGPVFLPPQQQFNSPYGSSGLPGSGYLTDSQAGSPSSPWAWPSQFWNRLRNDTLPRLLERPRWRTTWLEGGDGAELDILETELATTLTIPAPGNSRGAFRFNPGFNFLFLDGPETPLTGFDLPAHVYSAYAGFDLNSDPQQQAGVDVNFTVGVYTDFRNVSSDSLRLTGTGLGWVRLNPYTVFKLGIEYYDRIQVKMLPAFGVFMQPNSDLRIDAYFPRPRLSHKLPSLGSYEVWGYIGAEYGGGSWTIRRLGGADDQVDINDVRAFLGYEWMGPRRVTGFIEGGYVFEREILYRSNPANELRIPDTFMIRAGIAF